MGIELNGKMTLNGPLMMGINEVIVPTTTAAPTTTIAPTTTVAPDPFAGDVKFLATFENGYNSDVSPYTVGYITQPTQQVQQLSRVAGASYDGSYVLSVPNNFGYGSTYIQWNHGFSLSGGFSPYTVEVWAKRTSTSGTDLILSTTNGTGTVGATVGWQLFTDRFHWVASNGTTPGWSALTNNTDWHHYAVTYDNTVNNNRWNIFIDGVNVMSTQQPLAASYGTSLVKLGYVNGPEAATLCYFDNVRVTGAIRYPGTTTFTPPTTF